MRLVDKIALIIKRIKIVSVGLFFLVEDLLSPLHLYPSSLIVRASLKCINLTYGA